jgi:hypothetical protein
MPHLSELHWTTDSTDKNDQNFKPLILTYPDPCRRLAHETHEPHENQTNAKRFIVLFSPWVGEMKAGLILPGTASFRVIRVFRGALRLHHYGLLAFILRIFRSVIISAISGSPVFVPLTFPTTDARPTKFRSSDFQD